MTARYPSEHERINAREYPGTRQLCARCDDPTGRCEEDAIYAGEYGPLCEVCEHELRCDHCDGAGEIQVKRNSRGQQDYLTGSPTGRYKECEVCGGVGYRVTDGEVRT
jgi:hypothetical protein